MSKEFEYAKEAMETLDELDLDISNLRYREVKNILEEEGIFGIFSWSGDQEFENTKENKLSIAIHVLSLYLTKFSKNV